MSTSCAFTLRLFASIIVFVAGIKNILLCAATVLFTVALIYLTPLKWVTIIEPSIKDVEPVAFYNDFVKDSPHYIFIDVRSESAFEKVHAVGSINIPLHALYDERRSLPKSGKEIILICSGGSASGVAYSYLEHYGFFNIQRISGGIESWIALGLPVEGTSAKEKLEVTLADPLIYCV